MAETPPLIDRRAAMAAAPGIHALLIGVSDYANLSAADDPPGDGFLALQKLDFAALSALRLKEKLVALDGAGRLPRPLKTVRLLVAPSPAELAANPAIADGGAVPTWAAIRDGLRAWRQDVAQGREEIAVFYFGGHGIRRALEESILLASDFLDPAGSELDCAFRLSNLRNGMAPSAQFPAMGRDQFYFVDACRDKPAALDRLDDTETRKIWNVDLNGIDDRRAPLFLSTPAGGVSAGESGGTTYFMEALLWAMDQGSYRRETLPGVPRKVWPVRATSLKDGLESHPRSFEGLIELTGLISDPILCYALDPPRLTLHIDIGPVQAHADLARAALVPIGAADDAGIEIPGAIAGNPCAVVDLTAGLYKLSLTSRAGGFGPYESDYEQIHVGFTMPWLVQVAP